MLLRTRSRWHLILRFFLDSFYARIACFTRPSTYNLCWVSGTGYPKRASGTGDVTVRNDLPCVIWPWPCVNGNSMYFRYEVNVTSVWITCTMYKPQQHCYWMCFGFGMRTNWLWVYIESQSLQFSTNLFTWLVELLYFWCIRVWFNTCDQLCVQFKGNMNLKYYFLSNHAGWTEVHAEINTVISHVVSVGAAIGHCFLLCSLQLNFVPWIWLETSG